MVSVHLADWERRLLAEMVGELRRNLLDHTPARDGGDGLDPSLRRLFPPAYLVIPIATPNTSASCATSCWPSGLITSICSMARLKLITSTTPR